MLLPNPKRLNKNDYPKELQAVIEQLSLIINDSFSSLYDLINGKISLADNTLTCIRDVTITVNTEGIPVTTSTFSTQGTKIGAVKGCHVIQVTNLENSATYPQYGVTLSFVQSGPIVKIIHATGIQPNTPWLIRLIAYG